VNVLVSDYPVERRTLKPDGFPVLVQVSHCDIQESWEVNHHCELEFHLIRHGTSKYNIRGVEYPCERNSLLIIHENEPHGYIIDRGCRDKNMALTFAREIVGDRVIARAALQRLKPIHHLILSERQASVVEFLITEVGIECKHQGLHWKEVVADHVESFLAILHRVAERHNTVPEINDPLVQKVVEYLEKRITEKSSLIETAKHFGVSCFTLSKKFNHHMGLGFREYLLQRRILSAQTLLEQTDMKVVAIAYKSGFDSQTAFNRDFRRLTGMTPAVYRKLSGMEDLSK